MKYPQNSRVYVSGLDNSVITREMLTTIFEVHGKLAEPSKIKKKWTHIFLVKHYPQRQFTFVQYTNPEDAIKAIRGEHGRLIGNNNLQLNFATERPKNDSTSIKRKDEGKFYSPPSQKKVVNPYIIDPYPYGVSPSIESQPYYVNGQWMKQEEYYHITIPRDPRLLDDHHSSFVQSVFTNEESNLLETALTQLLNTLKGVPNKQIDTKRQELPGTK